MNHQESISAEMKAAQDKLISNVKDSLNDAEALLREAANSAGDRADELRAQALKSLRETRVALNDAQDEILAQGRRIARETDHYVHDNPWQAVGVAGLVGLLLGVLLTRR